MINDTLKIDEFATKEMVLKFCTHQKYTIIGYTLTNDSCAASN